MAEKPSTFVTPSKLDRLRAKVHSSRQKVAESKKTVQEKFSQLQHEWDSIEGTSSDHSRTLGSIPLHLHYEEESKALKEELDRLHLDREKLQDELLLVRRRLEEQEQDLRESKRRTLSESDREIWEDRIKSLESINETLKEQGKRDQQSKDYLTNLCEELEHKLGQQQKASGQESSNAANDVLMKLHEELKEAQSREMALQREADFFRTRHEETMDEAKQTEERLQRELERLTGMNTMKKRYGSPVMPTLSEDEDDDDEYEEEAPDFHQEVSIEGGSLTRRSSSDGLDTMSFKTDDESMMLRVQEFEGEVKRLTTKVKTLESQKVELASTGASAVEGLQQQIATLKNENQDFAKMGEAVVSKLQFKIATLKTLLATQTKARKEHEENIKELKNTILTLERGGAELRTKSHDDDDEKSDSIVTLSRQISESNANFAALEEQVSDLRAKLLLATKESEAGMGLLDKKEEALEKANKQNQSLTNQLKVLQEQINHLSDMFKKATSANSESESELLMELYDTRSQMDALAEVVSHHKTLLTAEQTRSSNLSQEVHELKIIISQLKFNESTKVGGDLYLKIKSFQEKLDELIQEVTQEDESEEGPSHLSKGDKSKILTELETMQTKAKVCILILEKEVNGGEKDSQEPQRIGFSQRGLLPMALASNDLRVRIANETTKRSKDLVVPISSELSLYETIYNNNSVKSANIRKWPNEIVQDVKNQKSEIVLVLMDSKDKKNQSFSIDRLKLVSTEEFCKLVKNTQALVNVILRHQRTRSEQVRELKMHVDSLNEEKRELIMRIDSASEEKKILETNAEAKAIEQRKAMGAVTTELAMLVAKSSLKDIQLQDTVKRVADLRKERKEEIDEMNDKVEKLEFELEYTRAMSMDLSALEIPDLRAKINHLEHINKKLNAKLKKEAQVLKSQEGSKDEELLKLKAKLENATSTVEGLKTVNTELTQAMEKKINFEKTESSRLQKLETENEKLKKQLERNEFQNKHLLEIEAKLREELHRQKENETIHTTETAVQIVDAEYAEEVQESLQDELDSANILNKTLSKQIHDLQKQIDSYKLKEAEYKQKMEKDEEMKSSITSLTSILEEITVSNKTLTTRNEELEAEVMHIKAGNSSSQNASAEEVRARKELETEIESLRASLQAEREKKEELATVLMQREQTVKGIQENTDDANSVKERNKDVLAMLERSHLREGAIQAKYSLCSSELETLKETFKSQIDSTLSKVAQMEKEVEDEKYANEIFKGIIRKLNEVNNGMEEKSVKKTEEIVYLKAQYKELSKLNARGLQKENFTLKEEVEFLRDQKARFVETVAIMERQLEQLVKELEEGQLERKRLEAKVSKLEQEQGIDRVMPLEAHIQELSQQLQDLQKEHLSASEEAQAQEKRLMQEAQVLGEAVEELRQKLGDPLIREKTDTLIAKVRRGEAENRKLTKERDTLKRDLKAVTSQMQLIKNSLGDFGW